MLGSERAELYHSAEVRSEKGVTDFVPLVLGVSGAGLKIGVSEITDLDSVFHPSLGFDIIELLFPLTARS